GPQRRLEAEIPLSQGRRSRARDRPGRDRARRGRGPAWPARHLSRRAESRENAGPPPRAENPARIPLPALGARRRIELVIAANDAETMSSIAVSSLPSLPLRVAAPPGGRIAGLLRDLV